MKRLLLLPLVLIIGLAFGQSENPCEDERYLEIKKKTFDEMSEREYDYFIKNDEKCKNYQQKDPETAVEKKSGFSAKDIIITGGINLSTVAGYDVNNDVSPDFMGFRFGIEKTLSNGNILGATFSQRGFLNSYSETIDESVEYSEKIKSTTNYLTTYILYRLPLKQTIDLLLGPEFGYFFNAKAENKICINADCNSQREDLDRDDWDDNQNNLYDFGLNIGGRVLLNEKMYLVGTYYLGLADTNKQAEIKNRSIQLGISYVLQ